MSEVSKYHGGRPAVSGAFRCRQLKEQLLAAEHNLTQAENELSLLMPLEPPLNSKGRPRRGEVLVPQWWPEVNLEVQVSLTLHEALHNCVSASFFTEYRVSNMLQTLRWFAREPESTFVYRGMLPAEHLEFEQSIQKVFVDRPVFGSETVQVDAPVVVAHLEYEGWIDEAWYDEDAAVTETRPSPTASVGLKRTLICDYDSWESEDDEDYEEEDGEMEFRLDLLVCGPDEETAIADWNYLSEIIRRSYTHEAATHKVDYTRRRVETLKKELASCEGG